MKETRRIAACINFLESKVIAMPPVKPEETLHDYLRRHFEKISKGNAQQLAGQKDIPGFNVVIDKWSSDRRGN